VTDLVSRLQVALADRYRIERELGQGVTATVYLAEALKHHRTGGGGRCVNRQAARRATGVRGQAFIQTPLRKQPYGDWEFEVRDPNGYVLVFSELTD
jgi:hypothetical protein